MSFLLLNAALISMAVLPASPQDSIPLSTGRRISPVGAQTPVGSFPANMLLTPDGRHVVVTNTGYHEYVTVLSAQDGRMVSRIEVGKPEGKPKEGLYYGLAFGGSGAAIQSIVRPSDVRHTLYVSRGAEDRVAVYTVSGDGKLVDTGRRIDNPGFTDGTKHITNTIAGVAVSRDGRRVYAVNNNTTIESDLKGSVSVLDSESNRVVRRVSVGGFPFGVAALTTGPDADRKIYVSSERDGLVSVVDPDAGKVIRQIRTGENALSLLLDRAQKRLFVANAGSDTVSVIDTAKDRLIATIMLRPDAVRGLAGATPTGMALSPDESHLYVTLGDMNAVAVVDLPSNRLTGYIPTGWYPTSCVVSADGKRLFVSNAKGINRRNPNAKDVAGRGRYILGIIEGTVSTIPILADETLLKMTAQTLANNRFSEARPAAIQNPGIKHVIYIIKENRTYDQVLGDVKTGNGDPSLTLFDRAVTPNQHALAERFVLLDNFFVCAEVSADGWNWSTSGMANEYTVRNAPYGYSGRGRSYDYEGQNNGVPAELVGLRDVARSPAGYIWDHVIKAGISLKNFGFFVSEADPKVRLKEGSRAKVDDNTPNKKALIGRTDVNFRQFDTTYADSDVYTTLGLTYPKQMKTYGANGSTSRFAEWRREFDRCLVSGSLPQFMMVRFPNDHTDGTAPGFPSPRAMVADNDYAVGQLVEAVSNSPFWKETAIFILEDDAQDGNDHVDAHRSPCYVISPFVKPGTVDSTFYNTDSLLRTMENLLGIPPMNQYDATATPFGFLDSTPSNDLPFASIIPPRSIASEVNKKTAYRAKDSARFPTRRADAVPDGLMNDILWHAIKGVDSKRPPARYTFRFGNPRHDSDD